MCPKVIEKVLTVFSILDKIIQKTNLLMYVFKTYINWIHNNTSVILKALVAMELKSYFSSTKTQKNSYSSEAKLIFFSFIVIVHIYR